MINLLPPDVKSGYRFARRNVGLRRWVGAFVIALVGLGMLSTYGLLRMHQTTTSTNTSISKAQILFQQEKFTETQAQVQNISNSFKLVVKVLGQEVLFSKLLQQIGSAIPSSAILTGLTINQSQAAIDITAVATNYTSATQVQVNLSDPANQIFSKADIVSITCDSSNATNPKYPCNVDVRALFSSDNPFLFVNSKAGS